MKRSLFLLWFAALVLVAGCASQPPYTDPFTLPQIAWRPRLQLEADEATRILGDKSRLDKVSAYQEEQGTRAFQSAFRNDPAAGTSGVLGYMYEEYPNAQAARAYMDSTLQANRLQPQDAVRIGGAELHYFTGGDLVRMVMILKDNRIVRLKVNPVPAHYSLAELRKVAAELAARL